MAVSADAHLLESIGSGLEAPWPAVALRRSWTDDSSSLLPLLK